MKAGPSCGTIVHRCLLLPCALLLIIYFLQPASAFADHAVNINTADQDTLMILTGIGEVKARAIIDHRDANGPFATIEDIQNVSGIGEVTFNSIKGHIVVGGGASASPPLMPASDPPPPPSPPKAPSDSGGGSTSASPSAITLDAGSDRSVVAGADTIFRAKAYNKKKEPLTDLLFRWNFGDGSTAMGSIVTHSFAYTGRFSVVLTVVEDDTASDQLVVTVDEMQLTLSALGDGVSIENQSRRDIDMSAWIVRYQGQRFAMPPNTIVLGGQTLRLTPRTLGFTVGEGVELVYPNGVVALTSDAPAPAIVVTEPASSPVIPIPQSESADDEIEAERMHQDTEEVIHDVEPVFETSATSAQVALAAASVGSGGSSSWWLGALGIALFGSGAVYAARRFKKREWNIVEE